MARIKEFVRRPLSHRPKGQRTSANAVGQCAIGKAMWYSNRFWRLLFESGLVPEPVTAADDGRLPAWGFGVTNLIPRPTPGIDTLRLDEYLAGARVLHRKVRRWKPPVMALVGVTLYRSLFPKAARTPPVLGLREEHFEGAQVFVLPNPSGRNANYSYDEMLSAFTDLRCFLAADKKR
jgi:TDG/mug DNA glycosylase family protein